MKYLLFVTPQGGYFPSLVTDKQHALNKLRNSADEFIKAYPNSPLKDAVSKLRDIDTPENIDTVHRPGIYQWHEAFNKDGDRGEVRHTLDLAPSSLEDYDIIHINGAGTDTGLVEQVKTALHSSSTIVIYNLDYSIEAWQHSFPEPRVFFKALMLADFVFAVEPGQQAMINYMLRHTLSKPRNKVSVPIIPHPVDVEGIRKCYVSPEERQDKVFVCYHRYDRQIYIPSLITWDLIAERGGVKVKVPVEIYNLDPNLMSAPLGLFWGWHQGEPWEHYLYDLSHDTIGFELYTIHSHSRFPEECAVLGVPCVGTSNAYSIAKLHPYTAHGLLDFGGMRQSLIRLVEDQEFYKQCVNTAWTNVQELNHQNSKTKLLFEMNRWLQAEGKQR